MLCDRGNAASQHALVTVRVLEKISLRALHNSCEIYFVGESDPGPFLQSEMTLSALGIYSEGGHHAYSPNNLSW
jgi:hypothetical protein